ncbi:uncharacterized protein LOC111117784 isoform X2 [Crassostrea virginica]
MSEIYWIVISSLNEANENQTEGMDITVVVCALSLMSVTVRSLSDPQRDPCPDDLFPVCGEDNKTYRNECELEKAGVDIAHEGECARVCKCPKNLRPVCGENGITYNNECLAECEGVMQYENGPC